MTVAAFIVSVVALLVAGLAALFTGRQAKAAEETADIERRRHHEERKPAIEGTIESINDGGWYRLDLRLVEGGPLANVTITIVEGDGIQFSGNQHGVPGPIPRATAFTVEPLKLGAVATWRVLLEESYSSRMRLECVCLSGDGDRWETSIWVDLPTQAAFHVW